MAEELENSLLKSIEAFLNERLESIEKQLDRLQKNFNEQIAQVRESAASTFVENTPLATTVAGHLQTAREQKLTGSTAAQTADLPALKNAIREIQSERTQSDVLTGLLRAGARFADRTVLFVVRANQAIAWRACQANRGEVEPVAAIVAPLSEDNIVGRAARSRSIENATVTGGGNSGLITQLGGETQQAVAIPLVVRNKVVAVLYADSAWPHPDAIQLEALEVLERVATMAVELVSPRVAPAAPPPAEHAAEAESSLAATETAAGETRRVATDDVTAVASSDAEPPQTEAAEGGPVSESSDSEAGEMPIAEPTHAMSPEPAQFTPEYSAPLGGARRFGASEADLQFDVSDEERRFHNDARRFARLLVSEIKLYNEQKVSEGRSQNDLYDRLREDIDRSRQMYDKRVAPPVAARHDYFHQELVSLLAEGDASKLGSSYPGATIAA